MKISIIILLLSFIIGCNPVINTPVQPVEHTELFTVKRIWGNNIDYINRFKNYIKEDTAGKFTVNITVTKDNYFTIKRSHDSILITGSQQGMWYFLDKYCGVRVYLPDTLFITKVKDSIFIPDSLNITHAPFTSVISSTGLTSSIEGYWALANNVTNNTLGIAQHSMCYRFMDSAMYKLFPDVYHDKYPTSLGDQSFEPDFTSPQCVPASMYSAKKFFVANPAMNYISFSVMDSRAGFPAPITGKTLSQTFTDYINELADSFKIELPGKVIVYQLYSQVADIPYVILRNNVLPTTVYQFSNAIVDGHLEDSNLNKMSRTMNMIGNHDWAQGGGFIIPRIYSSLLDSVVKKWQLNNLHINYAANELYPNWGLDGMKYYEMSKIYDNPYASVDSIRTLFCNDMFGNVAPLMKKYFDDLEKLSIEMANNPVVPERKMYNYFSQVNLDVTDDEFVKDARTSINEALNNSSGIINQRVQFFSIAFKISEGIFNLYENYSDGAVSAYLQFLRDNIVGSKKYIYDGNSGDFISNIQSAISKIKSMQ